MTYIDTKQSRFIRPGYSLMEILIAITIIGVLVGGVMFLATTVMKQAKRSNTTTALQTIKYSLSNYKSEKGEYPKSLSELVAAGFFPKPIPKDGWDRAFVYRLTPDGSHPYELFSYGAEGKGGGKAGRIDAWSK